MSDFDALVREGARYLEQNRRCPKHRVEHSGSNCYLLDFYSELGDIAKGKELISYLGGLVIESDGARVFYPGHLDPMNMSQNVIDTGACVDSIARFMHKHRALFSEEEHARAAALLKDVVESYLAAAAKEKYLTNQRLWGLTGLASFARYARTREYDHVVRESVERAFADMTVDGFFLYLPHARAHGNFEGYEGITAFYQSRCSAFIRYALRCCGIDETPYEERLRRSERALLAMYKADGTKDMRMECKRWYWLSPYEVASAGFDTYALAHSREPAAAIALHNLLHQVRRHFFDGYLHSHLGAPLNFQCPIFWTAHLAWMLRVEGIRERFAAATSLRDFSFRYEGKEVFTDTTSARRTLVNARFQKRNANEGIYDNGLSDDAVWRLRIPSPPPAFLFSLRESLNHAWYALRGLYVREALLRLVLWTRECIVMLLPRYSPRFGKVTALHYGDGNVTVEVLLGSKYGTLLTESRTISL